MRASPLEELCPLKGVSMRKYYFSEYRWKPKGIPLYTEIVILEEKVDA